MQNEAGLFWSLRLLQSHRLAEPNTYNNGGEEFWRGLEVGSRSRVGRDGSKMSRMLTTDRGSTSWAMFLAKNSTLLVAVGESVFTEQWSFLPPEVV
jgi:hypothetical protein